MRRLRWRSVAVLVGLVSVVPGCKGNADDDGSSGTPTAKLRLTADPKSIRNDGEATVLTLTATQEDGSEGSGTVDLSAEEGTLSSASVALAAGKAQASYSCVDCAPGTVRVTAKWNGRTALLSIGIEGEESPTDSTDGGSTADGGGNGNADAGVVAGPPASIGWVTTTCNGQSCNLMGIKTSGFNEQAQVAFQVQDAANIPVRGVTVNFSLLRAPSGTQLENVTAVTNANGVAIAKVVSGLVIGAFVVKADVDTPALTTTSPTIGVRGAKPSNRGFMFQCERINIPTLTTAQPPLKIDLNCGVGLTDRYNNPVGTGTSVFFKTEAGAITNEVATQAFNPTGDNTNEGTGGVVFRTAPGGAFPPQNVDPLPALANQWPYPRDAEPTTTDASGVRNPRDMLVTMLAYVQGEEHFDDNDADGVHDANEPFIDQGEPFVDANDNNTWDPGEVFIDPNKNNVWDGPNGVWDADTTIWTQRPVLYTGYGDPGTSYCSPQNFSSSCPGGVGKGSGTVFPCVVRDFWMNFPTSGSTSEVTFFGDKGSADLLGATKLLDTYGFGYERRLVDSVTEGECTPSTAICEWKTLFTEGWIRTTHFVRVKGASATDTTPCQNVSVWATVKVGEVSSGTTSSGAIQ